MRHDSRGAAVHVRRRCAAGCCARLASVSWTAEHQAPALKGWSGLNNAEWDNADLAATITEYQPVDDYCCCFAVQAEIIVIDADIVALEHAAFADKLANDILGVTPLVRIGAAPKCIRVYRAGDHIKSRKLHPSRSFAVPANLSPSAGTPKPAGLTSGRANPRSRSPLTAALFQR